jgi:excisionase family DNA binding protein
VPLSHGVAGAAGAIGISRSKIYELIRSGELRSVKVGGRRLIRHSDLVELLEKAEAG